MLVFAYPLYLLLNLIIVMSLLSKTLVKKKTLRTQTKPDIKSYTFI